MLGPGRKPKEPAILAIRELTREELKSIPRAKAPNAVVRLRESHHRVARLIAMGLRPFQVAEETGYALATISQMKQSPAFQELVAQYTKEENAAFGTNRDEYYSYVIQNRIAAARRLYDKLHDEEEEFTVAQLVSIHADSADRTGYPKRSVAININADFAARLDKAVKRTQQAKVIDAEFKALPPVTSGQQIRPPGDGEVERKVAPAANAAPLLRRA